LPWHLSSSAPGCSGWAVVLDATGKVVGCHESKAKALKQLAALNANAKEAEMKLEERAEVDNSAWDGNAAMTACNTAADYNKICAGKKAGDPKLRSSHALPHHYLAKAPVPNAAGVRAALARFSSTEGLTNAGEARRHLEAHMRSIQAANEAAALPRDDLRREISPGFAKILVREEENEVPILAGYFARYNEWTPIDSFFEGRFVERVLPGAFADSFEARTPKITFNHGRDPDLGDKVLGSPVTVGEDSAGATYAAPLFPGVPALLVDGLRAGAYGSSFRFTVDEEDVVRRPERSEYNPEGLPERSIVRASVFEVGPVTFPAYAGATAGVRSITDDFRSAADVIGEMARHRPGDLRLLIQKELGIEEQPLEEQPPPAEPLGKRFSSREEWLSWLSTKS
jgi:phage head maturation protease